MKFKLELDKGTNIDNCNIGRRKLIIDKIKPYIGECASLTEWRVKFTEMFAIFNHITPPVNTPNLTFDVSSTKKLREIAPGLDLKDICHVMSDKDWQNINDKKLKQAKSLEQIRRQTQHEINGILKMEGIIPRN